MIMRLGLLGALACLAFFANNVSATIIGTNPPAQPVTLERIAALSKAQQPAWRAYLKNSERQWEADRTFFTREMQRNHMMMPVAPPETRGVKGIPLGKPASWYGEAEALRIADIVISFQTPAGGWSKNIDMTKDLRVPGERFSADNTSRYPTILDNDAPHDRDWNYVGTFDNDATVTQLRFLAKVARALELKQTAESGAVRTSRPGSSEKRYRAAFVHGLDYIFAAQYPNGGWPQVWPLQGGYHDAITYNDDAMIQVLGLLREIANGANEISKERRNGYAWYRDTPTRALERYAEWRKKNFATH